MAYTKTVWIDQNVENPRTYVVRDNGNDTVTLLDSFGEVTDLGTPVNATNMNHIENGIYDLDQNKAADNAVVHLAGSETITGNKTFTGSLTIPCTTLIAKQDGDIEGGEIRFQRGDNDPLVQDPSIDLYNGDIRFLYCNGVEIPESSSLGAAICTSGINKSSNGYVKLGNGIIIQWGRATASNVALTITLPTAFSSATSYSISAITNNGKAAFTQTQTSTTFHLDASGGIGGTSLQWIAIGY